jgi:hypothetical protein
MEYKIRKKERKDCSEVAHLVTVAWNETCLIKIGNKIFNIWRKKVSCSKYI